MAMNLFAQITKVDVAKREVIGRAVQEVPDHSGEIFDYATSKPFFKDWSDAAAADTDGKSLGNLRAMHGKIAAGKLTAIDFNDTDKAIDIKAKVVDDNEWNKVLEGVYTGFSIGGSYVGERVTEKIADKEVKRYTAKPSEISLVDAPCIPTAKFFDIVKADGIVEKTAFKPAAVVVTGTDAQVAEFGQAMNDKGLSLADVIALVQKAEKPKPAVKKSMWNVSSFADVLSSLASVARSAQYDLEEEGDGSPVPAKLRSWIAGGIDIFKAMAIEEADELVNELQTRAGIDVIALAVGLGDLKKKLDDPALTMGEFSKIAAQHLSTDEVSKITPATIPQAKEAIIAKASTKMTTANKDRLQAAHDHLAAIGAACGADKAAPTGEIAKVQADLATALADIAVLKAQPVPYVTLRTVSKSEDNATAKPVDKTIDPATVELTKADYILNGDGSVDWQTSRYVKAQKLAQAAA